MGKIMKAYMCSICGFLYDDQTAEVNLEGKPLRFEELNDEWVCPNCGAKPDLFKPTESDRTPNIPV